MERFGPVTKNAKTIPLGMAQIRIGKASTNIATPAAVLNSTNSIGALASTKWTSQIDKWTFESGWPLLQDIEYPIREGSIMEAAFHEITPFNMALTRGIDPFGDTSATVTELQSNTSAGTTTGTISPDDDGGVSDDFTFVFDGSGGFECYGAVSGHVGTGTITVLFEPDNSGNPYFSVPANYFDSGFILDDTYVIRTTAFAAGTTAYANDRSGEIYLGALRAFEMIRMEAVYTFPDGLSWIVFVFPQATAAGNSELDFQKEDAPAVPISFNSKRSDSGIVGGHSTWDDRPLGWVYWTETNPG